MQMTTYIVHTYYLYIVYWIIVTLSHHFMALPVNLECCRPCHLLQNYQITQPVFVGGCWVLADVCTGSHSALKCMLNNKKFSTTLWQKNYCLNLLNTFVCIKGVVQYYCSSTFFSILSYYAGGSSTTSLFSSLCVLLFDWPRSSDMIIRLTPH